METGTCKRELVIEIPVDVVRREEETVTAQYARNARIPGFRTGHAPRALVRRHFSGDIRSQVVQLLVPRFFENAVKDQKWSVVGRPRFEEVKFEDNQPITCKATFEVYPEFEVKEYQGLAVEEEPPTVTEADIDQALEDLREHVATFEVVEGRPAAEDDYVIVNYQGRDVVHPEAPPVEARDALVHLGGKGTAVAFTENLVGARPGEVREFQVTYPGDYPQTKLAGKTLSFRMEVQSIKKKVVPAVNDDLVKSVSEFATLEELRNKLRQDLTDRRRREVEASTKKKLLDRLLEAHSFPVPETLIETQMDRKLQRVVAQLMSQGIDPGTTEIDWRKIREESRPDAEREVRASLMLQKIADLEKVEVPEEEVDGLVREIAQERQETPASMKTRLTREGELDRLKSTRRSQKALEFVYRNAKINRKNESDLRPVDG